MAAVPVLVAANHFGKQASQVRKLRQQWTAFPLPAPDRRLALFSDSLEQVDGVSTWCKRFVARARAAGHTVLLPQCCPQAGDDQVAAFTSFAVPLYPCMRFHVPSLTQALEWAWRAAGDAYRAGHARTDGSRRSVDRQAAPVTGHGQLPRRGAGAGADAGREPRHGGRHPAVPGLVLCAGRSRLRDVVAFARHADRARHRAREAGGDADGRRPG